jgi:4-hydroxy-tetrahydrodipicolinate reductase
MKITLIGYGKMGKAIEQIALERGHEIVLKISKENKDAATIENLKKSDLVIEFTNPESAFENVSTALKAGLPVVCGSTGWNERFTDAEELCEANNTALIHASNFSIGVNLFFELNRMAASLMHAHTEYEVSVSETHHKQKLDAPSGTAITIAETIMQTYTQYERWSMDAHKDSLKIEAFREDDVPGTHVVKYSSAIDDIELKHTAHSRTGFALGAVLAAEFLLNKKGNFTMRDVLFTKP